MRGSTVTPELEQDVTETVKMKENHFLNEKDLESMPMHSAQGGASPEDVLPRK